MEMKNLFGDLPTLETERLWLRKLTQEDAADMFEYAADSEVSRYLTWEPHKSIEESCAFIQTVLDAYREGQVTDWGIEHKRDRKLIGTCGFIKWVRSRNCAEIGYALSQAYWHRGLMTEAVTGVADLGFRDMGIYRLEAFCAPPNVGSARVLEKLGMHYEGTLRARFFFKGDYHNMQVYSILRPEWSGIDA